MEDFSVWFSGLDGTLKMFWISALVGTLVFVIQFILTFIGVDSADTDFDFGGGAGDTMDIGGALSLFSVRNIVNFFMGFGWGGVCLAKYIHNTLLLVLAAFVIGVIFVIMFFLLVKQIMKLESNGTVDMNDCVGKICDVYLRIPAERNGKGKVQLSINGTVMEFDAITDEKELIPTGQRVKVLESLGNSTLLVARQ